ncbi:sugar nucleotide-binding protein [Maridesulfovibrio sp.]|uniref:sugar nucleotide-binding protein n=1 Tax=Maridesulfovibrio sp. TaxID=2795000 RepID=UPI0029F4A72E|nr:sugar nucleotide-binding protein [Maridesulfovibrio sp.]
MKILIIGDGSLGNAIAMQARKSGHEVVQTSRKNQRLFHLDLKSEQKFTNIPEADWAAIAAGISGYKECDQDPDAYRVNVTRTIELCRTLLDRGVKILFPSSTAVFDGEAPFPAPESPTSPVTEYGKQKVEVENFLRQQFGRAAIVRLSKILDRETPLIHNWLKDLAAGKKITPFEDLTMAPVLFEDAARACCTIMEKDGSGIFQCSAPQEVSYLEFALKICTQADFELELISPASCKKILNYCPKYSTLDAGTTEKFVEFNFPAVDQLITKILQPRCLLCGSKELHSFDQFKDFPGITSDCKPWPRSGKFMLCKECGHAQKKLSAQWFEDINEIYSGYEMYPLSNGSEPLIFDEQGNSKPRSGVLLDKLIPALSLPEEGSLLDVGCGNGSLLQQFHERLPHWKLFGHEQSAQREEILHLPGVEGFFSGEFKEIEDKFDLITLTYVIEHLTDPLGTLKQLAALLNKDGQIIIHTSSFESNPFDLMVCDHCSHFTPQTLEFLATEAGLFITTRTDQWLAKEIGFSARKTTFSVELPHNKAPRDTLRQSLEWLEQLTSKARRAATGHEIGIFGTAVAGTWLAASLAEATFFIDEDSSKQGRTHMGLPIIGPASAPHNAAVIMGFNNKLATRIAARINSFHPGINFIIPDN